MLAPAKARNRAFLWWLAVPSNPRLPDLCGREHDDRDSLLIIVLTSIFVGKASFRCFGGVAPLRPFWLLFLDFYAIVHLVATVGSAYVCVVTSGLIVQGPMAFVEIESRFRSVFRRNSQAECDFGSDFFRRCLFALIHTLFTLPSLVFGDYDLPSWLWRTHWETLIVVSHPLFSQVVVEILMYRWYAVQIQRRLCPSGQRNFVFVAGLYVTWARHMAGLGTHRAGLGRVPGRDIRIAENLQFADFNTKILLSRRNESVLRLFCAKTTRTCFDTLQMCRQGSDAEITQLQNTRDTTS
uniref:Uncharacterized protein n=1 Tax=Ananas comosus var. bracteatus TaxID=296719 RepID=A0A6V7NEG9_ANACO|nr:unnamed protein product [Ananas comosus var. bracteatus]